MEKPLIIQDCKNLQRGDAVLVDAMQKNELMIFTTKMPVAKYPLTQNGRKCRSVGLREPVIFADEENCKGDEKVV